MQPTDVITTKSGLTATLLLGDVRETLAALPDGSVHCCVTSPPYFGLRDYGTGEWEGGDVDCAHLGAARGDTGDKYRDRCRKCGATRIDRQIGLEPTPDAYVAEMVKVFREVRRVLRDDGTCWINLGDSYAGSGKGGNPEDGKQSTNKGSQSIGVLYGKGGETARQAAVTNVTRKSHEIGIKPKDLIGIPWRVAFALQADGWYLRSDIIWHKPNPMPESVTDRPTKAHEYLFLLTKSERYAYDADAIAEPAVTAGDTRHLRTDTRKAVEPKCVDNGSRLRTGNPQAPDRNKRSVWTVNTHPYPEAHFATFPPKLIEPCIKAGCPAGGTVLDPFGGSGTTALVALDLGCNAILCELNPDYLAMAAKRIQAEAAQGRLFT
jgi:DNA modification methylase